MAVSDAQYQAMLARITKLEQTLSDVLQALPQLISVNQYHQLRVLDESRIGDAESRIQGLEQQLTIIVNDPT